MKCSVLASDLRAALDVAVPCTAKTSVYPILTHVLCQADPETGLTVTGDGGDRQRAWRTVPAIVETAGAVTLPTQQVSDLIESIDTSATVEIVVADSHKATLTSGKTRLRVAGFDPEEFPAPQTFDVPSWDHTMPGALFAQAVASVAHAIAPDNSREVLAGISLAAADDTLTLAAADGFRLAVRTVPAEGVTPVTAIVSGKALAQAVRHLGGGSTVRLALSANVGALLLDSDASCWSVRLIEGQFPDFRRIVPTETPILVTVAKADLVRATRLTRNLTTTETKDGRQVTYTATHLSVGPDGIEVSAVDGDRSAETQIEADLERGEPLAVRFNGTYFRDAVGAIESERVTLELQSDAKPAVIREAGARNGHVQVVMPMIAAR